MIAGQHAGYLLIALEVALSTVVAGLLFDVALCLTRSFRYGVLALVLYLVSETALWDNDILSDSLYSSIFNIVALNIVLYFLKDQKASFPTLACLGALWGFDVLVRDSGLYFTIIPVALLALPPGKWKASRWQAAPVLAFLLPAALIIGSCLGWNAYRTDEPFVSVTPVANFLRPAFEIERQRLGHPFSGNDPIDQVVRGGARRYDYTEQPALLQQVHDALGLTTPLQLQRAVFRKYLETVCRHPLAYARYVAANLDPSSFGAILFDPLFSFNEFYQEGVPPYRRVVPGSGIKSLRQLTYDRDYGAVSLAVLSAIATVVSTAAWIGTAVGVPFLAIKERARTGTIARETAGAVMLLGIFFFVAGFFALVHTEARYDLPIIASGLAAAVFLASRRGELPAGLPSIEARAGAPTIRR